jgi:hypothetical protein
MMSMNSLPGATGLGTSAPGLAEFNRAVSDWSHEMPPELQRVARIIGNRMGWDHNEFTISWSSVQRHYEAAFKESISLPTLKKYARLWADQGGLKIVPTYRATNGRQLQKANPDRRGEDGKHVGTRGGYRMNTDSNRFVVDFDIVVKSRRVFTGERGRPVTEYWTEPWTFGPASSYVEESQDSTEGDVSFAGQLPVSSPSVAGQLPLTTFNSVITPFGTTSRTANPGGNVREDQTEVKVSRPVSTTGEPVPSFDSPEEQRAWIKSVREGKTATPSQPTGTPATPGDRNVITFWKDGKGQNRIYTGDKLAASPTLANRIPGHAKRVTLQPDHAAWMWQHYGKGFPDAQMDFLAMTDALRAQVISGADGEADRKKDRAKEKQEDTRNRLVLLYRAQLIDIGVAAEQIDQRIATEWADLDPIKLAHQMKLWARSILDA